MFVVFSSLVKNKAKVNAVKNNVKSIELNTLWTPISLFCYDCNEKTKRKLEDENKTNIFYVCLAGLSDEK